MSSLPGAPWARASFRAGAGPLAALALSLALALGITACSSSSRRDSDLGAESLDRLQREQARGSLAAVVIRGQPRATVCDTLDAVFVAAGFRRGKAKGEQLVFERPASRGQRAAYGNWMGGEVLVRMRIDLQLQGKDEFFVTCRSFVVREGGSLGEDEQPLARTRMREFRPLLDEVANRLN